MTYWALNAVFLTLVVAVVVAAMIRRRAGNGVNWSAMGITMVVLILMTAIFDNVMIGVGLVGYNETLISGVFVGIAPLEDFAYAVAAVVLLPALWTLCGARTSRQETPNVEHDAPQ
jgi:lycopene cyclase domain-containing protein